MHAYMSSLLGKHLRDSISVDIKFTTDHQAFEAAVTDNFGHFKLRDESVTRSQQQQQELHLLRQMERQACRANIANVRKQSLILLKSFAAIRKIFSKLKYLCLAVSV